jgi:hypothetical protein
MVDAGDPSKIETARQELFALLEKPPLHGIPVSLWGCVLLAVVCLRKKCDM